jgi:short-subunit dehydrogenase
MEYALITGASKGIGKAIAHELAARGFNLLLVARSEELLQETAARITTLYPVKADWLALDLSTAEAPQNVYDWCRAKGYTVIGPGQQCRLRVEWSFRKIRFRTAAEYDAAEHVHAGEPDPAVPSGLSSVAQGLYHEYCQFRRLPGRTRSQPYAATKAFVLAFSRGLHQELLKSPITVTCISPGATDTDFPNRAQLGEKGLKAAEKFNMTPEAVASIAVRAMLAGKTEVITGFVNKVGAAMAWLLPQNVGRTYGDEDL